MKSRLVFVLLALVACGGDTEDPPTSGNKGGTGGAGGAGGQGGNPGQVNRPPAWSGAPATLAVREGEEVRVPFAPSDPDGDPVEASANEGDGWRAWLDGGELVVQGRFDGASSSTLELSLSDGKGGVTLISVPITVERRSWKPTVNLVSSGIEAREHPALLLDEVGNRLLVLGGSGYKPYGTPLGDCHEIALDGGAITARTPQGETPEPAGSRRVAQIPGERVAYLFGGYGAQGASNNDLFRVDLSPQEPVFTRISQEAPPSPRALHLFAFDPGTSRFFVFGGVGFSPLNDLHVGTLVGDTMIWKKVKPAGSPPSARYGFFYGVDGKRGTILLFSGAQGTSQVNPARDLWELNLRADPPAWTLLLEGDAVPEGRRNGAFAYDPARALFYVWGGTPDAKTIAPGLWAFDARPGVGSWWLLTSRRGRSVDSLRLSCTSRRPPYRSGSSSTSWRWRSG